METNSNVNNGLVNVAGLWVPESKVEARLAALARGRQIHQEMLEAERSLRETEAERLRAHGYSEIEINNMFRQERIEELESRGYGVSKRVPRVKRPA